MLASERPWFFPTTQKLSPTSRARRPLEERERAGVRPTLAQEVPPKRRHSKHVRILPPKWPLHHRCCSMRFLRRIEHERVHPSRVEPLHPAFPWRATHIRVDKFDARRPTGSYQKEIVGVKAAPRCSRYSLDLPKGRVFRRKNITRRNTECHLGQFIRSYLAFGGTAGAVSSGDAKSSGRFRYFRR